jgi:hypothetical protein
MIDLAQQRNGDRDGNADGHDEQDGAAPERRQRHYQAGCNKTIPVRHYNTPSPQASRGYGVDIVLVFVEHGPPALAPAPLFLSDGARNARARRIVNHLPFGNSSRGQAAQKG